MKDLLRLVDKMGEKPLEPELKSPPALAALPAAPLSYWVAGMINNRILQQNLLECASAVKRLAMEKEILTDIVKHYAATVSLKMAFAGGSSEGGSSASSPDAPPASS